MRTQSFLPTFLLLCSLCLMLHMLPFPQVSYLSKRGIFSHNSNNQYMDTSLMFKLRLKVITRVLDTLHENKEFFRSSREAYTPSQSMKKDGLCTEYHQDALHRFFIPSIWKDQLTIEPDDVTLATQFSFNRFHVINLLIKQWSGPLSLALYGEIDELLTLNEQLLLYPSILRRDNVDIHLVISSGVSILNYIIFIPNNNAFWRIQSR